MLHTHKDTFTLGIYGDGQLARLLASKAQEWGLFTLIYTLDMKTSPMKGVSPLWEGKSWNDEGSFQRFSQLCDVVVLENEFVPPQFLTWAEDNGVQCVPNSEAYGALSDKWKQVVLAQGLGIKVPNYKIINTPDDVEDIHYPTMLKALRGGYDGYGNFAFQYPEEQLRAEAFVEKHGVCLAQELIRFDMEVAVMVVRNEEATYAFPVVETVQEKSICHYAIVPARISPELTLEIQEKAKALVDAIDGIGLFGIEFFIKEGEIIFNEVAPRPHNSGHYSIEATSESQFEALLNVVLDRKLAPIEMKSHTAGMLNLLGNRNAKANFEGDEKFYSHPKGKLHWYGKLESKMGRKMGHFTLLGKSQDSVLTELKDLKERYLT